MLIYYVFWTHKLRYFKNSIVRKWLSASTVMI